jgi:ABC-type antimicrobial peptide transport system permease subunit
MRLVLREGAVLVGMGLLIGLPVIHVVGMLLRGVLVGVSPTDPATLSSVSLGVALVAMFACYMPARRVLRIDPAQSLRRE